MHSQMEQIIKEMSALASIFFCTCILKRQSKDNNLQMSSDKMTINTIQREIKSAQFLGEIRNLLQTFLELRCLNLFEIGFRSE